jgi:hypothetical protein
MSKDALALVGTTFVFSPPWNLFIDIVVFPSNESSVSRSIFLLNSCTNLIKYSTALTPKSGLEP